MMGIEQYYAFAIASLLLLLSPGPSVMYVTSQTLNGGRSAGVSSVAGLAVGDVVQVLAVAFGISAVVAAHPAALQALKWMGAIYLFYLAYRCVPRGAGVQVNNADGTAAKSRFRDAVIVNALNPKTTLFFLAFLPAFIDPTNGPIWAQIVVLGSVFILIGIGTNSLYAGLCLYGRDRFSFLQSRFMQNWLPAGVMFGLGVIALMSV